MGKEKHANPALHLEITDKTLQIIQHNNNNTNHNKRRDS